MRLHTHALLIALRLWTDSGAAAELAAPSLSLDAALTTALERHPSLRRLGEEGLAAEAREEVAKSAFFPRVTLEALGKEGPSSAPGFGFRGLANSTIVQNAGASVVLEQMIFDFGRAQHRTEASRWLAGAAKTQVQSQRALVTLGLYRAYFRALLAQQLVELAQENLSARETIVKQAEARAKAGLTSRVDEGLARASLAEAQVGLVHARNETQNAFAELNNAMGVAGAQSYRLGEPPEAQPASDTRATALEQDLLRALQQRPEMQALHRHIQAAAEQAEAAQAEGRPLVRALGSVGYLNAPDEFGDDRVWAVGLSLSYPLFTGGQVEGEVSSARHREAALQAARDELAQAIRLQVAQARMAFDALTQSRQAIAEQLTYARDSVKLATQRYREGLGDILELQQAQLGLVSAETSAARVRYDLVTAQAALRYALGTLVGEATEGAMPGKREPPGE
ncbi:MAG: TolC family protein [Gammaproteobacteria bacterium]